MGATSDAIMSYALIRSYLLEFIHEEALREVAFSFHPMSPLDGGHVNDSKFEHISSPHHCPCSVSSPLLRRPGLNHDETSQFCRPLCSVRCKVPAAQVFHRRQERSSVRFSFIIALVERGVLRNDTHCHYKEDQKEHP